MFLYNRHPDVIERGQNQMEEDFSWLIKDPEQGGILANAEVEL